MHLVLYTYSVSFHRWGAMALFVNRYKAVCILSVVLYMYLFGVISHFIGGVPRLYSLTPFPRRKIERAPDIRPPFT